MFSLYINGMKLRYPERLLKIGTFVYVKYLLMQKNPADITYSVTQEDALVEVKVVER